MDKKGFSGLQFICQIQIFFHQSVNPFAFFPGEGWTILPVFIRVNKITKRNFLMI